MAVNYLNNKDLLHEIHLSKKSYCSFLSPKDTNYDLIIGSLEELNSKAISDALANRMERLRKEDGTDLTNVDIPDTELVFRVMTWDHIPKAEKKQKIKTQKTFDEFFDTVDDEEEIDDLVSIENFVARKNHIKLNFAPFAHYRVDSHGVPYMVGKSHWVGDFETGHFSKTHGSITQNLGRMFIRLCDRYASRSNWRGYTYNEEMRGDAILQLAQVGLKFDESKSQNPFAYFTQVIHNSFTKVLNNEKKIQNIRDDILEINGLNPSWTRQNSGHNAKFDSGYSGD
jgi:hypothetical protein